MSFMLFYLSPVVFISICIVISLMILCLIEVFKIEGESIWKTIFKIFSAIILFAICLYFS